jgi:hypothetical protein
VNAKIILNIALWEHTAVTRPRKVTKLTENSLLLKINKEKLPDERNFSIYLRDVWLQTWEG